MTNDRAYEFCPQCARTMRPHCRWPNRCRWVLCGICNIIKNTDSGRVLRPLPLGKELK